MKRTCLFPLRTNAGFYRTQGQLDVKQRIKESVLLYDEIILESGLYIASIGPGGSFDTMGDADADAVDRIRTLKQRGGEFSYSIINDQTGQSTGRTLSAERRLAAEFLSIVDAIRADVGLHKLPDWFRYEGWFDLSRDAKSEVSRAARNDANRRGFWRRKGSHFLRDKVLTNFNYDLRLSAELGALVSMDGYFAPLVARKPEARAVSEGGFALRVLVPNVSALSWNELFELREEPGSVAFRAKLREVEEEAFAAAETLHEAREAVHRRWEWNLSEPWRTRSLSDRLGSILVDQAIGLLPPPMGNVAAAGRSIGDSIGHGHSWGAFFYKLRTKADAQAEPARSEDPARYSKSSRLPEGAGQLRDGGDGGEAARRGRGDVVAGGRGRSGARFKRRSNRLYWDYAKNEGLIRLGTSQDSSGPLFSLNHKYDRGRAKASIGKVAANSRKSSDDIPLYA